MSDRKKSIRRSVRRFGTVWDEKKQAQNPQSEVLAGLNILHVLFVLEATLQGSCSLDGLLVLVRDREML